MDGDLIILNGYFGKQCKPRWNAAKGGISSWNATSGGISSGSALLAKTKSIFRAIFFFEIITFDPLINTKDHPDLIVSNFMENSIGFKRVKGYICNKYWNPMRWSICLCFKYRDRPVTLSRPFSLSNLDIILFNCLIYGDIILMLRKRRQPWALYKVCLICIVIWLSRTGQRNVDEVLHPYVLQIYQTVGNNFLFQQDNASIPAIWQGTVCKLVMSYPLKWPSGSRSISDLPPLGYSRLEDTW